MALFKCPECKQKISTQAAACPHCGAPVDNAKAEETVKNDRQASIFGFVIVAVVIAWLVWPSGNDGGDGADRKENGSAAADAKPAADSDWTTRDNSSMAYIMMEDFVKRRLKAPSTAEFQGIWSGRGDAIKRLGDQTYRIDSYVDAQNGFGAQIRMRFSGRIKQISKNEWRLLELDIQ